MRTLQLPPTPRPLVKTAIGTTVLAAALAGSIVPAQADEPVVPLNSQVTIVGAGWGHGRGMSQYGAYGAASTGLDYTAIVAFYYPGTELTRLEAGNTVRVWLTADTDAKLHFRKVSGLQVRDEAGTTLTLPTSSKYTKWRISKSGGSRVLYYRSKAGKYVKLKNKLQPTANWYVANPKTGTVKLALPSGETKSYRGSLGLAFTSSGARTVNHVVMEDYLRSVVPAEMPASWAAEAVKAQSVAARTYAARLRSAAAASAGYDLCDTSACQVYKGLAWENAASDRAIAATADQVLYHQGRPAMTEFSSANGGWSAAGDASQPYLKSQPDPYDGIKRDQSWQVTVSSAKLANLFPGIGALISVQVLARDGNGTYGGRVESVQLTGTAGALTVTGADFKRKLGLKERLFTVSTGTTNTLARK